jgi:hypothetical protein
MSTESDVLTALAPFGIALLDLGVQAIKGELTKEQAARQTVAALVAAIPRNELAAYLTDAGVTRAEILADVAESRKFDPFRDPADD